MGRYAKSVRVKSGAIAGDGAEVCQADADYEQLDPLAVVTWDYVLVMPKVITLDPGSWVICGGRYYRVLVPHELDEYKNEYEIRRKEDC